MQRAHRARDAQEFLVTDRRLHGFDGHSDGELALRFALERPAGRRNIRVVASDRCADVPIFGRMLFVGSNPIHSRLGR